MRKTHKTYELAIIATGMVIGIVIAAQSIGLALAGI